MYINFESLCGTPKTNIILMSTVFQFFKNRTNALRKGRPEPRVGGSLSKI